MPPTGQSNGEIKFSPAMEATVAICFNKCPGNDFSFRAENSRHWLKAVTKIDNAYIILTNVYGYRNATQNRMLFLEIPNVVTDYKRLYHTDLNLFGGGFNLAPDDYLDRDLSKFNIPHHNSILDDFCHSFSLIDVWSNKNPNTKQYSLIKPNGMIRSRIDLWLASSLLPNVGIEVSNSNAPLTNHCLICLLLLLVIIIINNSTSKY